MKTFQQIGTAAGAITEEKNRAYGSSFTTAGAAMRLLYPNGIGIDQMADALVLVRIWDKLMRIATDRDALGESPYHDIIGYSILGVHMHQAAEGEPQAPCGSVSAEVAAKKSQAPSDSALPSAPPLTTLNASASSDRSSAMPSSPESPNTSASTGALASTATVAALFASASEKERQQRQQAESYQLSCGLTPKDRLRFGLLRNSRGECAQCASTYIGNVLYSINVGHVEILFDSRECVEIFNSHRGPCA
jgi:hypothetical protein